jgi:hypothetical protein
MKFKAARIFPMLRTSLGMVVRTELVLAEVVALNEFLYMFPSLLQTLVPLILDSLMVRLIYGERISLRCYWIR